VLIFLLMLRQGACGAVDLLREFAGMLRNSYNIKYILNQQSWFNYNLNQ